MLCLISLDQSAFVEGRNISENILLAQELVKHIDTPCRGQNIIFKFDMLKAFDRVSWNFLDCLLQKFIFSHHFIRLGLNILRGSWLSILING